MTKFTVTDTALKAGEPWGHAPIHVALVDSTGAAVSPAYVDATGVLVEAFDTVADGDGVFTLTLDSTADISPTGCFYLVRIGDADNIISGDDGDGTVRGLRASTPTVLGSTATFDGLADVDMAGKADGDVPTWDTTTGRYIPGTGGGGGGGVSSVSGTAPITSTGGATPAIGITAATSGAAGSMSAADKSKLDGIEAGATADQSAAELLTAIKTVDGTGSGLDADTVDGQHASAFEAAGTAAALVDDLSGVSNAATARTNLGLGDSATKNVGTGAGSVAAGDHNHTGVYEAVGVAAALVDDLSGVSNAATARTNLGLGALAVLSAVGSSEITNGAIVNEDINASAAIALSKLASISTARILGRTTSGSGAIEELSSADSFVSAASDTTPGKVELATASETQTGTDTARAVTPAGFLAATPILALPKTGSTRNWGWPGASNISSTATFALTPDMDWFFPFVVHRPITVDELAVVTTTNAAGKTAYLAICPVDGAMQPTAITAQGTVDLTTLGTLSWAANQLLTPGTYVAVVNHNSTAAFRYWYLGTMGVQSLNPSNVTQVVNVLQKSRTAGVWGSAPTWDTVSGTTPSGTINGIATYTPMRWTAS